MSKRILIVPLDWGLGHAARCVPLIAGLQKEGCEVLAGAAGDHAALLQQEFPALQIIPAPGYHITYSREKKNFRKNIITQIPKILMAIRREHRWLLRTVNEFNIDAVIADNRYGLYNRDIPTVFITHQLLIKTSFGNFADNILRRINYRYIRKYDHCWIPDFAGAENLAGALSHPTILPSNAQYIGCLSRFEKKENVEKKYELLILISGPEPMRSQLEKILLQQAIALNKKTLVVQGLPGKINYQIINENVIIVNHLPATQLSEAMQASNWVVSRCGYTTVMDLIKLQQKALLIPTPGQPEQEYLSRYLKDKKIFFSEPQKNFQLQSALRTAQFFPFRSGHFLPEMNQYQQIIHSFVASLH